MSKFLTTVFYLILLPFVFTTIAKANILIQQTNQYSVSLNVWQAIQELGNNLSGTARTFTFRVSTSRANLNQFDYTAQNSRIYDKDNNNSYTLGCISSGANQADPLRGLTFNTAGVPAGYEDVTIDFSCRNYNFIPGHRYLIFITNANFGNSGSGQILFAASAYANTNLDYFPSGGLRYANGNPWDYYHNSGSCNPVTYLWNDQTRNPTSGCNIWTSPRDDLYFILTDTIPEPTPTPTPTPLPTPTPTPQPAKTPLILIPGIGGSELKVNEDTVWSKDDGHGGVFNHAYAKDEKVWVNEGEAAKLGDDDYFDVLRMKTDGQTSEANLGLTGNLYSGAYQGAIDFFTSDGYILNKDLFVFPYDWRKDITLTANILDAKINQIKSQTGSQKVDIIAHSMGGLVARNYIADSNRAQNVRKLFTLGTPHLGSVKFLKTLQYGDCLFLEVGPFCLSITPIEVRDVIQNMISGFQLAPSQAYFNFYSNEDNKHPYPYKTESGALNYTQIKNLLTILGHNASLFNPSEAFHSIDPTLSNTNGVDVTVVAGSGQPTLGQIIEEKTTSLLGINGVHKDIKIINGDETVPLFSASLNDSSKNLSYFGSAKVYYTNQIHRDLVINGSALQLVKNILNGNTVLPSGVSTQPYPLPLMWLLSVHSPVNIHVYDSNGNHTGPTAEGFEANIPGSSYDTLGDSKFIYLPNSGVYTVNFEATDNGSFDFKIRKFENDVNAETTLYKDVPLTTSTKAQTTLDTSSTQQSVLQVDQDGNGTTDIQVNSTSVLSGNANYDETSPQTIINLTGTKGNNEWYKSDVVVTLTADDQNGSGVNKIEYTLDSGQTVNIYTEPFTISQEGITKLKFRSIDNAGNEETPQELEIKIDKTVPAVLINADPKTLWPSNNKMVDVKIIGSSIDLNPYTTKITVEDEYHSIEPAITNFGQTIKLQSSRNGDDKDGRKYVVKAVAEDLAGNVSQVLVEVIVPHDQRK